MAETRQIERIVNDIKILDDYAKLEILEKLVKLIRNSKPSKLKKERSLLDLQGLGKEVWEDVNADEYIDTERNSWN
jgi:hypothetical protein